MGKKPISKEGFDRLQSRLRTLKEVERPAALDAVSRARDLGDLSENADYKTARDAERQINGEIRRLETLAENSEMIDTSLLSGDSVMFGAFVELENEDGARKNYRILSEYESDPKNNIIAITSPLAQGLIGRRKGQSCAIRAPAGDIEYEIIGVRY